jgi:hypothetical protein
VRVEDPAILKLNGLEQRLADGLYDRADDLVARTIGVYDRARFPGLDYVAKPNLLASRVDLDAGGDVSALVDSACDAKAVSGRAL